MEVENNSICYVPSKKQISHQIRIIQQIANIEAIYRDDIIREPQSMMLQCGASCNYGAEAL